MTRSECETDSNISARHMGSTVWLILWVKGGNERVRDNRLRALRATRAHALVCLGGCDQEQGEIESLRVWGSDPRRHLDAKRVRNRVEYFRGRIPLPLCIHIYIYIFISIYIYICITYIYIYNQISDFRVLGSDPRRHLDAERMRNRVEYLWVKSLDPKSLHTSLYL